MTAPKRWYQLSMLQILVAMAVVSAAVRLNLTVTPEETIFAETESGCISYSIYTGGLPYTFCHAFTSRSITTWTQADSVEVNWRALTGNVTIWIGGLAFALALARYIPR